MQCSFLLPLKDNWMILISEMCMGVVVNELADSASIIIRVWCHNAVGLQDCCSGICLGRNNNLLEYEGARFKSPYTSPKEMIVLYIYNIKYLY